MKDIVASLRVETRRVAVRSTAWLGELALYPRERDLGSEYPKRLPIYLSLVRVYSSIELAVVVIERDEDLRRAQTLRSYNRAEQSAANHVIHKIVTLGSADAFWAMAEKPCISKSGITNRAANAPVWMYTNANRK